MNWNYVGYKSARVVFFGERGRDTLELAPPITDENHGVGIHAIGKTESRFFVVWSEWDYRGSTPSRTSHLTYVGFDGIRQGDYSLPPVGRVAWDGRRFGAVYYDEAGQKTIFYLLDPRGSVLYQRVVYAGKLHYESYPGIAYGNGFGIIASRDDVINNEMFFVRVICR